MTRSFRAFAVWFILLFAVTVARAQVRTGTPPFGSFAGGPDTVNLANLNVHLSIPVLHKSGRGTDFTYDLSFDSSVLYPVVVNGTNTWQPVANFGWRGQTEIELGYVTSKVHLHKCPVLGDGNYQTFDTYVYHDMFGISHAYSSSATLDCNGFFSGFSETAADGSGYTLNALDVGSETVDTASGTVYTPPDNVSKGAGNFVDRNGNTITVNSTGQFFDTLNSSNAVLSVTGSGTAASPLKFTYTSSTGVATSVTMNFTNYTVATNFAVPQVPGEYKSSAAVPLVSSIVLPDNSQYSFTYEATPGSCTPYSGTTCVTARIKTITLPTGGPITYSYSGGNNGILSDGSTATLTRATPDGTWIYAQAKNTAPATTTTVSDPANNQTTIQFQGMYETQRKAYQGTTGGTLLQTTNTCYNASASPCTATAIVLPITQRTVTATLPSPSTLQSQHTDKFDAYGNPTESDDYDFATTAPFPLLRQTTISYAALGGNLKAFRQTVMVKDGNGTIKSRQDTNYDQYSSFTGANCITGAPNHDDSGHGCSFTARANATSIVTYTDPVTPGGAITKNFTYDSLGNLRTAQLNCCQTKSWAYSSTTAYAYPDSVINGSSSPQLTTTYTYDLHMGLILTSTDPNSLQTTLTYDNMGRVLTSKAGSLPTTNYTYTDSGTWSAKVCSPLQGTGTTCQKNIFDSQGRTVTLQLLDGNGTLYSATDTQYDSFGRAYKTSNPYQTSASNWTQSYFDSLGRLYQTKLPDNSTTTISFTDNTATTSDPRNVQRKAVADGLGRLTSVYEPDPTNNNSLTLQTSYSYNIFGQLTQVTQGSQTRTYVYDALGRLLSSTTPEGGRTCFGSVTGSACNADGYDSFDNLLKRTDARGVLTNYSYDTLNRPYQISYNVGSSGVPATATITFTYGIDSSCTVTHGAGCIGQITTMTDGPGSENYTYNSLEQLTQLQKVLSGTTYSTSYSYNLAGELTQITYPSGRLVQQSVDAVGRLCEVAPSTTGCGTASSPYVTGYAYNASSQVIGLKYGNNLYASFGYSADRLQLNCLDYSTTNRGQTCAHDGTTKFGLNYSFGAAGSNNGLIASITDSVDNGRSATYTYDSLYRLSTAATPGSASYGAWGLQETYDRYGNRWSQSAISGCTTQTCPQPSVAVNATTNRITGSPYAYDANGNMTNDGINTIVYDAENHATSSSGAGGSGTYTTDGNGRRVKKVSGSTTTVYIFSGSKVIAEYDNGAAPASPSREYIYGGSVLIAKITSSGTNYYHQDHLSNRLVTSSTGSTVAQMGHFPFGESWYNATNDKLHFTTYERDAESGNDYAQARYYISRLARFSSTDPLPGSIVDPQSLNRYTYANNQPTTMVDPSGLCDEMAVARRRKKAHELWSGASRGLLDGEVEFALGLQEGWDDSCFDLGGGGAPDSPLDPQNPDDPPDFNLPPPESPDLGLVPPDSGPLAPVVTIVQVTATADPAPDFFSIAVGGVPGGPGGGSAASIKSALRVANLLLSDPDCAAFLKMILTKGQYSPNLDSFRQNLNALTVVPDPKGEVPSTTFVAHVHGYGVSDTVHVDYPMDPELGQVLLHETFHTIAYGISDAGLAQYTTGSHVSPGSGMTIEQAISANSKAASKQFAKHCDPSKVKKK